LPIIEIALGEEYSVNESFQVLLNYGKYYRIWPNANTDRNELYTSVGLIRTFVKPLCKLLLSKNYGQTWNEIADFHSMDKRNTTTGQPFITQQKVICVPVWSANFYNYGETWFAIYRSEDQGSSWEKVYEDRKGTYGKHFFQDPDNGYLYIGVGVGGGGYGGKTSCTPAQTYLLKSEDLGKTWKKILKINYPTALYSGVAFDKTVFVTAREKGSIFKSVDGGDTWSEISLGSPLRNLEYVKELQKFIASSDCSIFVSKDGVKWSQFKIPIKWLILRYPTFHKGKVYLSGVGGRSYVVSTDLSRWYILLDATKITGSNFLARMVIINDRIFLGDELNGILLCVEIPSEEKFLNASQILESNAKCFFSIAKYMTKRIFIDDVLIS
jgi:photosystem II stability/assembly factor-like uncharacterized protein